MTAIPTASTDGRPPELAPEDVEFYHTIRYGVSKDLRHLVKWNDVALGWMTLEGATLTTEQVLVFPESCQTYNAAAERARHMLHDAQCQARQESAKTLEELHETYRKWLPKLDPQVLHVVLACACDRKIPGEPVWLYLVANSGGLKTELTHALEGWNTYFLDKITPATLVSGYETKTGTKIRGIMPKLDGKVLLVRDFTLLLEMDRHQRNEVFAQLRVAYDGKLSFGYGVFEDPIEVKAKFGLIAAVTPIIDLYTSAQSLLGERFLKIRADQDRAESIIQSRINEGREEIMRQELNNATISYLNTLSFNGVPKLTEEQNKKIEAIAEFVAQARTVVKYYTVEGAPVTDIEPAPEYATRIVKQFAKLSKLIAIIRQHEVVQDDDMRTIYRIACDTILPRRLNVLKSLYCYGAGTEMEIVRWAELPRQPVRTALDELELIRMIRKEEATQRYALTDEIRELMKNGFGAWLNMWGKGSGVG